jgi:sporulation protein YlmC with PRC-barrel domain
VHLVRDVLDKAVVDRNGRAMGRVDRIILKHRRGLPSTVVALEIGPSALAHRVSRALGRWITGLLHGLGVDEGQPLRIHVDQIIDVSEKVTVDLAVSETSAGTIERKLRGFVSRLPGAIR